MSRERVIKRSLVILGLVILGSGAALTYVNTTLNFSLVVTGAIIMLVGLFYKPKLPV
jgi:hypothetical protein